MGNLNQGSSSQTTHINQNMLENLTLYQEIFTDQFGPIKVLKQKIKPYSYVMLYTQNGMDDRLTFQKMQEKLTWYKQLKSHPHIVDIEYIHFVEKNEMCIRKIALQIYVRYYNHTLAMAIERKILRGKRFKESDIFYVLKSLIDIWKFISENVYNKYVSLFNINNVFLSPEGYIKIYPFPIDLNFVSSPLKPSGKFIRSNSLMENEEVQVELSPKKSSTITSEPNISSPRKLIKQINEKDNLRDIGIILLQLVTLNKNLQEIEYLNPEDHLDRVNELFRQGIVSSSLRNILQQLLLRYKQTSYEIIMDSMKMYESQGENTVSTHIKLDDGPDYGELKEVEKMHNLRRLSEHKNLKAGIISVMSKQKSMHQ